MLLCSFCPLAHKQGEAGLGLDAHFPCSSISLHRTILPLPVPLFPTFPVSCPRVGLKSWKKAVSVPSQRFPPEGLHSPLGVTAGEEPPLSLICPKPGANSSSCPPACVTGITSLGFCPSQYSWLTRYSWLCSFGDFSPSPFFLIPLCVHPLLCLCCPLSLLPPMRMGKYATKPWDFAVK